jgi:branched-chain amino acid transport system substrate-binding protein
MFTSERNCSQYKIGRRSLALVLGLAIAASPLVAVSAAMAQDNTPFKIGVLSDMSGVVMDLSGPGTLTSIKMAVEDHGGKVLGRPIQLLEGDHLNKPDIGISFARKWYDEGVNAIFDVGITSVALGVQDLAREKNKVAIFLASASTDLTGKNCGPNTVQWTYTSYSQANGVVKQIQKDGGKKWFFLTTDYAFGVNSQRDATAMIQAGGGTVVGSAKHPFDATDFSSDLLKAQASGADVIALSTPSTLAPSIMKQADEFGIRPAQIVAPLSVTLHDVKAMGLSTAQGIYETTAFYWDQNDETRAFAKRFFERFKRMPNMIQASGYGAVTHYLKSVDAAGSDNAAAAIEKMKNTPVNDFMTKNAHIRPDGLLERDQYVLQVKTPAQSKSEWDIYTVVATVAGKDAYPAPDPKVCNLAK